MCGKECKALAAGLINKLKPLADKVITERSLFEQD